MVILAGNRHFEAKSDAKGIKVANHFNFKCHRGSFELHWNTFLP